MQGVLVKLEVLFMMLKTHYHHCGLEGPVDQFWGDLGKTRSAFLAASMAIAVSGSDYMSPNLQRGPSYLMFLFGTMQLTCDILM